MKHNRFFRSMFEVGTIPCALCCAVVGLLLALLLLWGGIWKTLLICLVVALFVFIGAVRDKKAFFINIWEKIRR